MPPCEPDGPRIRLGRKATREYFEALKKVDPEGAAQFARAYAEVQAQAAVLGGSFTVSVPSGYSALMKRVALKHGDSFVGTVRRSPPPPRRLDRRLGCGGRPRAQASRSSSRSGDSGDDSDLDEPPPRRRALELRADWRLWAERRRQELADLPRGGA